MASPDRVRSAIGLSHVAFRAPDLAAMAAFLEDFGLQPLPSPADELWMAAPGTDTPCHRTLAGDGAARFHGLGLLVSCDAALERLEAVGGRRGGDHVALTDPDGFEVTVSVGEPVRAAATPPPMNMGDMAQRLGQRGEAARRRARVLRLGHVVLEVADFARSLHWWQEHFGLIVSDLVMDPSGTHPFAAFLRVDRGPVPVDHHSLVLIGLGRPAFGHAAFEVADFDDLMRGHEHLKAKGHVHAWGVGRHIMGSQIFDYWRDPFGHMLEHWTDGDRLDSAAPALTRTISDLVSTQWGPPLELRA